MIDTALIPHGKVMFDQRMQLASLDHALWVHAPVRADDWLLYALDSPVAGAGRGFARGAFYTRQGQLIATAAQEGLMRERSTAFVIK
jgi:acyl-CoA thioesterase II